MGEHHAFEHLDESVDLGVGHFADIVFGMHVQLPRYGNDQILGHEFPQQLREKLLGLHLRYLALYSVEQRLLVERGFHVEHDLHFALVDQSVHRIAAQPQCHCALDASFREAYFSELLAYDLAVHDELRADITEQQASRNLRSDATCAEG